MDQIPTDNVEWDDGEEDLDTFMLSWESLARDWLRPEEDEAWAYLQDELKAPKAPPKDL